MLLGIRAYIIVVIQRFAHGSDRNAAFIRDILK
jgi:hypothetical protein